MYSELPDVLRNISKTHPRQIRQKAIFQNIHLSGEEKKVYGSLQGMFNAKPDLAILTDETIYAYEAKLTLNFDQQQLRRTNNIVEVWANLLYQDIGYKAVPKFKLMKIGLEQYNPDISWQEILKIISNVLSEDDKSYIAINNIVKGCC